MIQGNMKKSFPTLSDKELGKLTYRFYGYLTDQLVEFFKGVSISKEEMLDRFENAVIFAMETAQVESKHIEGFVMVINA